jgi:hypothetical protein
MEWYLMSPDQKIGHLLYKRRYRAELKRLVFNRFGDACECGEMSGVKLRFIDPRNPLKKKHATHPETLHVRILREPEIARQVALLCERCRLSMRFRAPQA